MKIKFLLDYQTQAMDNDSLSITLPKDKAEELIKNIQTDLDSGHNWVNIYMKGL